MVKEAIARRKSLLLRDRYEEYRRSGKDLTRMIVLIDEYPIQDENQLEPILNSGKSAGVHFLVAYADTSEMQNTSTTHNETVITPDPILIVTVLRVEAQAILEVFSSEDVKRKRIGHRTYYDLGLHGGVPVYMVQAETGTSGPGSTLLTATSAIQDLHAQAVIINGVAFGLHKDRQKLGDILVSKQLDYYEPQKIDIRKGQIPRGDRVTASERLLDRFRSGDNDWQGVKTHFGLVLSGEKLVKDISFQDWLLENRPEAIGGEMEGAGLYVAARNAKVDWIMVKGISDWADSVKINDSSQIYAAHNSAQFILHVIRQGGWNEFGQFADLLRTPEKIVPYTDAFILMSGSQNYLQWASQEITDKVLSLSKPGEGLYLVGRNPIFFQKTLLSDKVTAIYLDRIHKFSKQNTSKES
jgi:nucleoside phosphorylase